MPYFLFHELQLTTILLSICDFYMSWRTRFISLKLCVGFSIFDSLSFSLKSIFLFSKMNGLYEFTFFQNQSNRIVTHSFAPRPLIFKLHQEFLKSNDISVSWSSPKNDLLTNFLKLENRSFENVFFFSLSIVLFK